MIMGEILNITVNMRQIGMLNPNKEPVFFGYLSPPKSSCHPDANLTINQAVPYKNVAQRKEIVCMERQSEFNRLSVIHSFSW